MAMVFAAVLARSRSRLHGEDDEKFVKWWMHGGRDWCTEGWFMHSPLATPLVRVFCWRDGGAVVALVQIWWLKLAAAFRSRREMVLAESWSQGR